MRQVHKCPACGRAFESHGRVLHHRVAHCSVPLEGINTFQRGAYENGTHTGLKKMAHYPTCARCGRSNENVRTFYGKPHCLVCIDRFKERGIDDQQSTFEDYEA